MHRITFNTDGTASQTVCACGWRSAAFNPLDFAGPTEQLFGGSMAIANAAARELGNDHLEKSREPLDRAEF